MRSSLYVKTPAFPRLPCGYAGMSLLDYFAAAALTGIFAAETPDSILDNDLKAHKAYRAAEAMIVEREEYRAHC